MWRSHLWLRESPSHSHLSAGKMFWMTISIFVLPLAPWRIHVWHLRAACELSRPQYAQLHITAAPAADLAQKLPGSQVDTGADTAVRMVARRGLSSVCGRRDLPLTVQQHGPRAQKSCAASAGQLFSLLIKWRIWHLSRDAPSTVSDCHIPRADVSGCAAWQISPRTGKQILSFPPAKWLLVLFVLKKKRNSWSSAE